MWRRLSRRNLLTGVVASASLALVGRAVRGIARAETQSSTPPPRYWIQIVPTGGVDAVWTTDPRTARSVKSGVDVPYPASSIIEAGGLRLGPAFAGLRARARSLAFVNGVLIKAANHYTGVQQLTRLRTNTTPRTPSCLDIIGAHRDSQAIGHMILNPALREARTLGALVDPASNEFGGDATPPAEGGVLGMLEQLSPEELADLAKVTGAQIDSIKRRGDLDYKQASAVDLLGQSRALFERFAGTPRFAPTSWFPGDAISLAPFLQRALWLIENDLAATVTVFSNGAWDTHARNLDQLALSKNLASGLSHFFDHLEQRSNRHGKLSDLTAVMVASEIGRFPYKNVMDGKDHFPQVPVVFSGPAFRRDQSFGAVGKEMEGLPTSLETGKHDPSGDRLFLDDVGHTALRAAGIDPLRYGVGGRDMRFLREG